MIIIFRVFLLLLISVALLNPKIDRGGEPGKAAVLLDISKSMDPNFVKNAFKKLTELSPGGVTVYPFSGKAYQYPVRTQDLTALQNDHRELDINRSCLVEAVKLAGNGPAFLISDGNENKESIEIFLENAKSKFGPLYPIISDEEIQKQNAVSIANLTTPKVIDPNTKGDIVIGLENGSDTQQKGKLSLFQDGKLIEEKKVSIPAQGGEVITLQSKPVAQGMQEIKAAFTPDQGPQSASEKISFITIKERDAVLLVGGSTEDNRYLTEVLGEAQFKLKSTIGSVSSDEQLTQYHTILLNNISAERLSRKQLEDLRDYTRQGGRLVMIGGERSFGLGQYRNTPVEDALPVEMLLPQTEKKRLNVAVELVLDKSRSMAEDNKIEFVKEASREVIRNLKDDDYVGVIGFDATPFIVVKMGILAEIRDQAIDRISRLFASSRTNLMPAIEEGKRSLIRAEAGRKHMIILTDGKLPDANPFYIEIVKQLRILGITVSTVMLGQENDSLLNDMATAGGGAFYQTSNANALPKIFMSDIKVSTGERTLKENTDYEVRVGASGVQSTEIQSFPSLKGFVQAKLKDKASQELVTYGLGKSETLLASWQYGKGKGIAFTGDVSGRWSERWIYWPKFRQFWSEIINGKDLSQSKDVVFDLRPVLQGGSLNLDLFVYTHLEDETVLSTIKDPLGIISQMNFEKLSPGRYRAVINEAKGGRYEIEMNAGSKKLPKIGFYISPEQLKEEPKGINRRLLETIASQTGGVINPKSVEITEQGQKIPHSIYLQWPLTLLIFILFIAEVIIRELFWSHRTLKKASRV